MVPAAEGRPPAMVVVRAAAGERALQPLRRQEPRASALPPGAVQQPPFRPPRRARAGHRLPRPAPARAAGVRDDHGASVGAVGATGSGGWGVVVPTVSPPMPALESAVRVGLGRSGSAGAAAAALSTEGAWAAQPEAATRAPAVATAAAATAWALRLDSRAAPRASVGAVMSTAAAPSRGVGARRWRGARSRLRVSEPRARAAKAGLAAKRGDSTSAPDSTLPLASALPLDSMLHRRLRSRPGCWKLVPFRGRRGPSELRGRPQPHRARRARRLPRRCRPCPVRRGWLRVARRPRGARPRSAFAPVACALALCSAYCCCQP